MFLISIHQFFGNTIHRSNQFFLSYQYKQYKPLKSQIMNWFLTLKAFDSLTSFNNIPYYSLVMYLYSVLLFFASIIPFRILFNRILSDILNFNKFLIHSKHNILTNSIIIKHIYIVVYTDWTRRILHKQWHQKHTIIKSTKSYQTNINNIIFITFSKNRAWRVAQRGCRRISLFAGVTTFLCSYSAV